MPAQTIIKVRRDTAANWDSTNPTLAEGEMGYETDTGKFKIGKKVTGTDQAWLSLDYATDWANVTEKPTSFTPSAHATSHESGGTDEIEIAPAQITASATSGQVLSSDGTTTVWATPAGGLPTQTGNAGELLVTDGTNASWSNTVTANGATVPAIIAKGATSQTGNLQEWHHSSGSAVAAVSAAGSLNTRNMNVTSTGLSGAGPVRLDLTLNSSNTDSGNTLMRVFDTNGTTVLYEIDERGEPILRATNPKPANTAKAAGYKGMPQTILNSGGLTLSAAHAGDHILVTGTSQTITIPTNASVPFEIGTTIVVVNTSGSSTITSATANTIYLAGSGTARTSLTLAGWGMATILKITATEWIASGNGLS